MTKSTSPDKAINSNDAYTGPTPSTQPLDNGFFNAEGVEVVKTEQPAPEAQEAPAKTSSAADKKAAKANATAARTNSDILGASPEALSGDKSSLLETADTGKKRYSSLSEPAEPMAEPDNSAEGLDHNRRLTNARAFVRGQGFADHLYSDDSVMSEHERYMAWAPANYGKKFDMNLQPVQTYVNTPKGGTPEVVKKAEYATVEGAQVPHYKDKEHADTPTPAVPDLPNKA